MTYTHPPTQCRRELIFDSHGKPRKTTPEDVEKAVVWYERNWLRINESLPATIGATTFCQRWQDGFDKAVLPQWRSGKLMHRLACAYVYLSLQQLYRALEHSKASP